MKESSGQTNHSLARIIWLCLFIKCILGLAVLAYYHFADFCEGCYLGQQLAYPNEPISWQTAFRTWDANFFLYIADRGYGGVAATQRYFPLYPFLMCCLKFLVTNGTLAGLLLSNACSLVALVYLYKLLRLFHGDRIAFNATMYCIVFPTAFFFSAIYSESLVLMLSVLVFYHLYQRHYTWAAFFSYLLPLTKALGMLIVVPMFIYFLSAEAKKKGSFWKRLLNKNMLYLAAPVLGILTSLVIMQLSVGNLFASFESQKSMHYDIFRIFNPIQWFRENFVDISLSVHGTTNSMLDRLVFFFYLVILLRMYDKQEKPFFYYALAMGMVPALTDHFFSYSRHIVLVFPVYTVLAMYSFNHKYAHWLMFAVQIFALGYHCLARWVG